MGGAALRAIDALFVNTARLSVGGGVGYTDAVRREIGVPEGYVLSPLLFSLAVSELLEELESLGLGLSLGGVWCGAVALVDDVALLAASREEAVALLDAVALWCWRRRYLLSLKKCAFLCAGPGCDDALGTAVEWRWSPPPPAAMAAALRWNFTVVRVVKYLGVLVTTDLTFDAHIEQSANRATGELGSARAAVAAFGGLRRAHAVVAYVAYGRAYVEWAAPVYGALSTAAASRLEHLRRSAVSLVVGGGGGSDAAALLIGELPAALRLAAAAARFAVDLAAAAAVFPERAVLHAALSVGDAASAAVRAAVAQFGLVVPDLCGLVGPRVVDATRLRRVRAQWRSAVRRAAHAAAARAVADTGPTALALLGGARIDPAWRREFVMQAAVRDAPSGYLVHVLADEWDLVPDVRERAAGAVTRGLCDLCGAACAGDLTHVLFACPCAELAAVRAPWLAEVEAALDSAALGGWWAGLPTTIDGRGAAALGRLVEGLPRVWRPLRGALTRAFLRHFGAWWERAGDGAVARLAVH